MLEGEYVAIEEVENAIWNLVFDDVLLGPLDEGYRGLEPGYPF